MGVSAELISIFCTAYNINTNGILMEDGERIKKETGNTKPADNEFILKRFEELARENQDLKREIEQLKNNPEFTGSATLYPECKEKIIVVTERDTETI
jgi:hypothetical protein